jgi:8-oxo-dGTP diphosphatase
MSLRNKEFITGSLDDIGYVAIEAQYNGKWVMCFHHRRQKWECPGGHVESGELPLAAAKRELFEETGAVEFDIVPLWDFQALNEDGTVHNNGRTYYANIKSFAELPPESEMDKIGFFDADATSADATSADVIPENVTYVRSEMIETLKRAEKRFRAFYE